MIEEGTGAIDHASDSYRPLEFTLSAATPRRHLVHAGFPTWWSQLSTSVAHEECVLNSQCPFCYLHGGQIAGGLLFAWYLFFYAHRTITLDVAITVRPVLGPRYLKYLACRVNYTAPHPSLLKPGRKKTLDCLPFHTRELHTTMVNELGYLPHSWKREFRVANRAINQSQS